MTQFDGVFFPPPIRPIISKVWCECVFFLDRNYLIKLSERPLLMTKYDIHILIDKSNSPLLSCFFFFRVSRAQCPFLVVRQARVSKKENFQKFADKICSSPELIDACTEATEFGQSVCVIY